MKNLKTANWLVLLSFFLLFPSINSAQEKFPTMTGIRPKHESQPSLSPDSKKILYSSGEGFAKNLFVFESEKDLTVKLTDNELEDSHARWSPDGQWIVFQREDLEGNRDLYIIDKDGLNEKNLTNTDDFGEQHPRFSSDGQFVVFDSNRDEEDPTAEVQNYEIYSIDLEEEKVTRLTDKAGWDMYPSLSPEGTHIAWRRALPVEDSEKLNFEIFVKNLVTGEEWNVSNNSAYDSNPHWSPTDNSIVFMSNRGGSSNLFLTTMDGSTVRMITQAKGRSIGFGIRPFLLMENGLWQIDM